jgi:hypothetical protein
MSNVRSDQQSLQRYNIRTRVKLRNVLSKQTTMAQTEQTKELAKGGQHPWSKQKKWYD